MLAKLITVFKVPELRNKILLTLGLLAVYRMGFNVLLPFIDQENMLASMRKLQEGSGLGPLLQMVSLFSASSLGNNTIFGLGIMPYISASIIFQLLASVYPPLEKLQKEGEAGRRKINEYTRYATVGICLVQSFFWVRQLSSGFGSGGGMILTDFDTLPYHLVCTLVMTAGTVFLMWIGEQIDAYGIGNGISLLIMAGILARMPSAAMSLLQPAFTHGVSLGGGASGAVDPVKLLMLACMFVAVVVWVIAITQGQRRIPIQSAKHVRGRRVMGGQRQSLPLRVNQAGVMPIIFASSLLMFPMFLFGQLARWTPLDETKGAFYQFWSGSMDLLNQVFGMVDRGFVYNLSYIALIYFFCYFWTAITFNPKDMAENLKDYGSFIPGYRPGARTASYLEQVMVRITYVGAAFLALVAVIPTIVATSMGIDFLIASFYGGTGLLIVVSVALDLIQKIDSHLVMRNYPGLLDSDE